ncbi:glycosyltransferase family 4 protein [Candidatus Dependentiae bacterium]|nr:glycosyltransferase family 4 protein [Candidatus Dependentiae bacterium]
MKNKIKLEVYFPGNGLIQIFNRSGLEKIRMRSKVYLKYFSNIFMLSFGRLPEARLRFHRRIKILNNKINFPKWIYIFIFPFIHYRYLKKVDIIEARQISAGLIGLYLKLFLCKPLIIRCGYDWVEFADLGNRYFEKIFSKVISYFVYNFSDILYVTSARHREQVLKYGINPGKVHYISNAVDIEKFKPGLSTEEGLLISAGRLEHQKNYMNLLLALENFPYEYKLLIFGNGRYKRRLENLIRAKNLNVKLMGNLPTDELITYLQKSYIFILPSYWEGNSNALIEAVSSGCSIIASDIEANKEIIQDKISGILCKTDSQNIREKLIYLFNNNQIREELKKNARISALKNFNSEDIHSRISNIMQERLRENG